MDLNFTPEEEAFREEVQTFLTHKLPQRIANKVKAGQRLTKADQEEWHAILNERGWLANHWPQEWGGPGWNAVQKFIFDNECALAGGPRIVPFGVNMLGPVLIKYGNEAQKRYWLPRILSGADWWCQGYSEPGAGSDLASIKTTAVREGDHYIVNGQKTWTTQGQHANMIFCLVRTDGAAVNQRGISFMLIDLKSPGVEIRPIVLLDGEAEVNEIFFTDVRVPIENLVGEENNGWTYAKYLLTYERTGIAGVGRARSMLNNLMEFSAKQRKSGRPLNEDRAFARRLANIEIELDNMTTTNLRAIAAIDGSSAPGAESSMLKIRGTQIAQEISSLYRRAMGPYALPFIAESLDDRYDAVPVGPAESASAAAQYFKLRALSIYGGSSEIQRNIISKMILGL